MAKNGSTAERRVGAVSGPGRRRNPMTGLWAKRDAKNGPLPGNDEVGRPLQRSLPRALIVPVDNHPAPASGE